MNMSLLIVHIVVAMAGIVSSTAGLIRPSSRQQAVTWTLIAATVASGTVLTFQYPSHLVESCVYGLFYIGFTASAAVLSGRRLATSSSRIQK